VIVGTEQLATLLGLNRSRIHPLVAKGMPKLDRGKFDAPACIQWYVVFKVKGHEKPESTDVNMARKRLYDAQVVKTNLDIANTKRQSIPSDEHMIDMNQLAVMFSSGLDALGGRLAAQLAGMTDPAVIAEHLTLETNAIRESVAGAIAMYASTVSHE
jgi:phage terminase Nu1 subunit (DNA packaging protein)